MQTFITLWKFTKEGLIDIRNTPERFKSTCDIIASLGGKLVAAYGLIGEYDVMTIMEMPDEKAATAAIVRICSKGRVLSHTMLALPMDEFLKITREGIANPHFVIDRSCS
ncbi:MAG: GYD domain-containing protein [Desulfobacterota bacterium]|nr:GYD domain-containing protein [Thermodesulfobacteriota bacterium]